MRAFCVTPAIVLRSWPFGESDKIVSFFTEGYGKIVGIAKGAQRSGKRFVNVLEPFSLVSLRFHDRPHSALVFIHACDLIRVFKDLASSLEKLAHASYLLEMTDELAAEREENRPLFQHLRDGLSFVEERGPSLPFVIFFELRLLKLSGYQPVLDHCRRCGLGWQTRPKVQWRFSPREGGVLCGSCSTLRKEAIPISAGAMHALVDLQKTDSVLSNHLSLSPSALRESRAALLRFIQFQINKELKSAPFLQAFSSE